MPPRTSQCAVACCVIRCAPTRTPTYAAIRYKSKVFSAVVKPAKAPSVQRAKAKAAKTAPSEATDPAVPAPSSTAASARTSPGTETTPPRPAAIRPAPSSTGSRPAPLRRPSPTVSSPPSTSPPTPSTASISRSPLPRPTTPPISPSPPRPDPRSLLEATLPRARTRIKQTWDPLSPRLKSATPFFLAIIIGLGAGAWVTGKYLSPLTATLSRSETEEAKELERLEKEVDDLFVVKVLRGKTLGAGKVIRGEGVGWREVSTLPLATGSGVGSGMGEARKDPIGEVRRAEVGFERERAKNREVVEERERQLIAAGVETSKEGEEGVNLGNKGDKEHRLEGLRQQAEALGLSFDAAGEGEDTGPERRFVDEGGEGSLTRAALGGSQGLAVERVFWNERESELVAVVWLGRALCGWPGVVHGGLLATVMAEKIALAGALFGEGTLSSSARSRQSQGQDWRKLDDLEVQYRQKTMAGAFYVIRAYPKVGPEKSKPGVEVEGTLEDLAGKTCVQVKGTLPSAAVESITPALRWSWWKSWLRWT